MVFKRNWKTGIMLILFSFMVIGCSQTETTSKPSGSEYNSTISKRYTPYVGRKSTQTVPAQFNRGFLGRWLAEGLAVEFDIELNNGEVRFSGRDLGDGEKFKIQSINWTTATFMSTFSMPSTGHVTTVRLSVLSPDVLKCQFSGDATGETLWKRK